MAYGAVRKDSSRHYSLLTKTKTVLWPLDQAEVETKVLTLLYFVLVLVGNRQHRLLLPLSGWRLLPHGR